MTDEPSGTGTGAPGADADPYVPTGVRRSTYTPPGTGAQNPDVDDDALAEAMAAEVASYTSPVSLIPPVEPLSAPPAESAPVQPAESTPVQPADPVKPADPEAPPSIPTPPLGTSMSPTLEAIERLESELRRRAEDARAVATPASAPVAPPSAEPLAPPPDAPLFPAPPTFLRPSPPEGFGPPEPARPDAPPPPDEPDEPVAPAEPPAWAPAAFGEAPPPPPLVEPPAVAPPPLVEPPAPGTGAIDMPSLAPPPAAPPLPPPSVFGAPPSTGAIDLPPPNTAAVDLPPPVTNDLAHLPPPVGIEPVAIPPYDPGAEQPPRGPYDEVVTTPPDDDDVVDDVDRAYGTGTIAVDSTGSVHIVAPPSQPIPTVRLADDEPGRVDERPESHPALLVEAAGAEPTPLDLRAGRAARLFWLWFAANSSVVSLTLGAVLFGMGMSLRQALVAIFLGVALSCLPLGLVTLAGKWSGQPTMIVSRATFGIAGNGVPAVLALVSRVFWGGALLWVLATGVAAVLVDAGLDAGLGEQVWTLVGLGAGFALAFVVAIFGYGLIARVQLVLSILTGVLVIGVVLLTLPRLNLAAAQSVADGPWMLLVTGVVLVFSFVGLAWVHSSADVARYQRTESDGGANALWATFGATLPALILVAWGALLAASDPLIADGLATNPLYTIAALLPLWYPAPLIAALALGLISGVVLTIYSGGFALQSLGVRARRSVTTAVAGALVLGVGAVLIFLVADARGLIIDIATTIAVPVAAWAGIFGAEVMIRRRRFDGDSLLRSGGVYPAVRWPNLIGLVVISAVGFGLTSAALPGFGWQGYLLPFLGLGAGDPLLTSDVGVLVVLILGILLPLTTAWRAIRRQEAADPDRNLRS